MTLGCSQGDGGVPQPTVRLESLPGGTWAETLDRTAQGAARTIAAATATAAQRHVSSLRTQERAEEKAHSASTPDTRRQSAAPAEGATAKALVEEELHSALALQSEVPLLSSFPSILSLRGAWAEGGRGGGRG